jgi:hypothetical protein
MGVSTPNRLRGVSPPGLTNRSPVKESIKVRLSPPAALSKKEFPTTAMTTPSAMSDPMRSDRRPFRTRFLTASFGMMERSMYSFSTCLPLAPQAFRH